MHSYFERGKINRLLRTKMLQKTKVNYELSEEIAGVTRLT